MSEAKLAVGHKIRTVRKMKEVSQEYLAGKLKISQPAFSKIESNETKISYEMLNDISIELDVDINDILNADASTVFNNNNQIGGFAGFAGMNNTFTFSAEDIKEIFGQLLEEKNKRIELLERLLNSK